MSTVVNEQLASYKEALPDNDHLKLFMRQLREFDDRFCGAMFQGSDFTLKLEIRATKGKLIHCRVSCDEFVRPEDSFEENRRNYA